MIQKLAAASILCLVAVGGPAKAQSECTPLPSACQAANDKAISYMNRIQGGIVGTHGAMSVAYCANMATANILHVCSEEYRAAGKTTCANLTAQQMQSSLETARQADAAASATYAGSGDSWKAACGF